MRRAACLFGAAALLASMFLAGCPSPAPGAPHADFSADVTTGVAPLTVQFTDRSTPGGSPITARHWLFGDGAESTERNPSRVYTGAGAYNVSLEVTTAAGTHTALNLSFVTARLPIAGEVQENILPGNVSLEMVWIPAETFTMGSPNTDPNGDVNEGPEHTVDVGGCWMAKYELTKRQWTAVMNTTPWYGHPDVLADLDSPAVWVSWDDAQAFITAANNNTGKTFRLPSEAEWEHVCRAGTGTRFYWGDDPNLTEIVNYAWFWDNSDRHMHTVGGKTANAFGLHDMSGNISEWCQDFYHDSYAGAPRDGNAWESPAGSERVIRGGNWGGSGPYRGSTPYSCRSAARGGHAPSTANYVVGLRLSRS